MKEIPLTQGKVALVDDEDYERVMAAGKWCAHFDSWHWYAKRNVRLPNGKKATLSMHRFILGLQPSDPYKVDHRNREETLNNCKSNLRIATTGENNLNRGTQKNNTSGIRGVDWHTLTGKWRGRIGMNNKRITLGYFPTLEAARDARDAAALQYHGEFAVLSTEQAAA